MPVSSGFGKGYTSSFTYSEEPLKEVRIYENNNKNLTRVYPVIPNQDLKPITYEIVESNRKADETIYVIKQPANVSQTRPTGTRYIVEKQPRIQKSFNDVDNLYVIEDKPLKTTKKNTGENSKCGCCNEKFGCPCWAWFLLILLFLALLGTLIYFLIESPLINKSKIRNRTVYQKILVGPCSEIQTTETPNTSLTTEETVTDNPCTTRLLSEYVINATIRVKNSLLIILFLVLFLFLCI